MEVNLAMLRPSIVISIILFQYLILYAFDSFANENIPSNRTVSSLPEWFDSSRLQAHTLIGPARNGSALNIEVIDFLNDRNIRAFTRHVKTDWRPPAWHGDSDEYVVNNYGISDNFQLIKQANAIAKKQKIQVGAYYWNGGDTSVGFVDKNDYVRMRKSVDEQLPINREYLCKDVEGSLIPSGRKGSYRGLHADLASDFKNHVAAGLATAVELGFSSLFFDERHYPNAMQSPCFGGALEQKYNNKFQPLSRESKLQKDKKYWSFVGYQALEITKAFEFWKQSIAQLSADKGIDEIPFVISGTYLATLVYPHMNFSLANVADSVKTEYKHGVRKSIGGIYVPENPYGLVSKRVQESLAWIIARDFAGGRPPYIWNHKSESEEELLAFVVDVILHGGIAALHIADAVIDSETKNSMSSNARKAQLSRNTSKSIIDAIVPYASRLANLYSSTKPMNGIALLIDDPSLHGINEPRERLKYVVEPLRVWATLLSKAGLPFRVLNAQELLNDDDDASTSFVVIGNMRPEISDRLISLSNDKLVIALNNFEGVNSSNVVYVDSISQGVDKLEEHSQSAIKFQCSYLSRDGDLNKMFSHPLTTFQQRSSGQILLGIIPERNDNFVSQESICSLEMKKKPTRVVNWKSESDLRVKKYENTDWGWQVRQISVKDHEVFLIDF